MRREEIDFGINIKRVRLKHKLTQAQFAEIIGKSQSTVYGYENNTIVPPFKVLVRISSLFNMSVNDLMGIKEPSLPIDKIQLLYDQLCGDDDE